MSVSQISVCNSALVKVGAERISSITEDNKRAKILNAIYDQCRDSVLAAHPWKFATKRVILTPTADTPAWGYTYEYDEPADCLNLLETDPDDIEFVSENKKIRTDEPSLNIRYIFRQVDESTWSACFAEAFAWRLAMEIAYNLTQSVALVQSAESQLKKVLAEARWADGNQGSVRGLEGNTWTDARRS